MSKLAKALKQALPTDDIVELVQTPRGQMALIERLTEVKKANKVSSLRMDVGSIAPIYKKLLVLLEDYTDGKEGAVIDDATYQRRLKDLLKVKRLQGAKQVKASAFKEMLSKQRAIDMETSTGTSPKGSMRGSAAKANVAEDKSGTDPITLDVKGKAKVRGGIAKESETTSSPPGEPPKKPRKKTGETSGTVLKMKGKKPKKKKGSLGEIPKNPTTTGVGGAQSMMEKLAAEAKARGAPAPVPVPAPAPAPAPAPQPEVKTGKAFDPKVSDADPIAPLPTKGQMIPSSRLSASGKKSSELRDDIRYFLNNFPDLEKEAAIYKKLGSRATKTDLVKLHSRIVGKVRPAEDPRTDAQGRRVGVVLDGESYIRGIVNDMLTDQRMSGLRPEGLVSVNQSDEGKGDGVKDIGDFEVKPLPDGGYAAKREAIYRFQPSENDKEVNPSKSKNKRFDISKSGRGERMNNLRANAMKSFKRDPFTSKQPRKRLNYLY